MPQRSTIAAVILFLLLSSSRTVMGAPNACDLVSKQVVEEYSGLTISNVSSRDRGAFTSCTFETDDWQVNVGLIYYPGPGGDKDSDALAAELKQEIERDEAPYTEPTPLADLGNAAASYESVDGDFHSVVVLSSGGNASGRLVVSAPTQQAALDIARAALAGK